MAIPKRTDVVVIGGGPAGSMAATYLRQKGYDVVLFDKKQHPRYMVGESIIPHIWKYCDLAGVSDRLRAEGFVEKQGGTVIWDGVIRQVAFKNFGYRNPALHVERDRFDYLLLDHARGLGARVFERVTALGARLGDEPVVAYRVGDEKRSGEIACRFVVDASGQGAVIAKQLGIRVIDDAFRFMSIWGYYRDSGYVSGDGRVYPFARVREVPPTTFVTSVAVDGRPAGGWAWHIPQRESTSVGLVLPIEQMKAIPPGEAALEKYFRQRCAEIPYLDRLLEDATYCEGEFHAIRDYSYRPTQVAGPGFFLTGDAAAFIDPIFSVGVVLAMYSAYVSAWAIHQSFRNPAKAAHYRDIFAAQLMGRIEVSRSLALPPYGLAPEAGQQARTSIQFETGLEQELMYVVSTLTSRSDNFAEMAHTRNGHAITSERFRVLERIEF
jgi:flavin-dependent dehydrogenase